MSQRSFYESKACSFIGGGAFSLCVKLTEVTVSPVDGRKWDVEVEGSRNNSGDYQAYWIFERCPLNDASKTALRNAGYPTDQGKF